MAVTLFSPCDKGLLDGEHFKVHNNLSPESFKRSIFVCAQVTSNNNLNGAQFSSSSKSTSHGSQWSQWQAQVNHGPVHKLLKANPPTRRAETEIKHIRQGFAEAVRSSTESYSFSQLQGRTGADILQACLQGTKESAVLDRPDTATAAEEGVCATLADVQAVTRQRALVTSHDIGGIETQSCCPSRDPLQPLRLGVSGGGTRQSARPL